MDRENHSSIREMPHFGRKGEEIPGDVSAGDSDAGDRGQELLGRSVSVLGHGQPGRPVATRPETSGGGEKGGQWPRG